MSCAVWPPDHAGGNTRSRRGRARRPACEPRSSDAAALRWTRCVGGGGSAWVRSGRRRPRDAPSGRLERCPHTHTSPRGVTDCLHSNLTATARRDGPTRFYAALAHTVDEITEVNHDAHVVRHDAHLLADRGPPARVSELEHAVLPRHPRHQPLGMPEKLPEPFARRA